MTVSAVVFDHGGVITDSPLTAFAAYEAQAGLLNLKPARALGFSTIKVADPAAGLAALSALVGLPLDGAASGASLR
ncbi:MAG: Epoxide hydrolase N-terminal domain-like phosphatase [Blastococcus sp.]|nr:Epoxide hydrolase N-terminal domain-like phosphatase [Blastococcus sp.]